MRRSLFAPRPLIVVVGILSAAATPRARGQACLIHERQKLVASDAAVVDRFGKSVSISGDWAIIGAYLDDDAGTDSGSAYVFRRDNNGTPLNPHDDFWVEAGKLIGSDSAAGDGFGASVSISGDRAIVGAMYDDDACPSDPNCNSGSAYAFRRDDNGTPSDTGDDFWVEEDKLTASDGEPDDYFGGRVAIDGERAIVGVSYDDDAGGGSGSAYVFRCDDGGTPLDPGDDVWIEEAKLTASDAAEADRFGVAVSISGAWLIVGASGDDDTGDGSGSAYVFRRDDNTTPLEPGDDFWIEQAKLTAQAGAADDRLGAAVALSGDWAIVGAYASDGAGANAGSAHVYRRDDLGTPSDPTDDSWIEVQELTAWDADAHDWFGSAVSISGARLVVGASQDDDMGSYSGSAYVFRRDDNGTALDPSDDLWVGQAKYTASDGDAKDLLGVDVSISGDRVLVGAYGDDDGAFRSGSAYVFGVLSDGTEDCNANGILDGCEPECNGNGIPDDCDIADATSDDCNANGIPDECEPECNGNGIPDDCDIADATSPDCNVNGIPDECEPECNGNGIPDDCDIANATSLDCNANGIPDECDPDCNGNGIPDDCDIADGTSQDCSGNGVPNECEPDCNGNGSPDDCDIVDGSSEDCSSNGTPDECEPDCNSNGLVDSCDVHYGTNSDCNRNGSLDECDIADGTSDDLDGDGVPDECAEFRWRPVAASDNVLCLPGEAPCGENEIILSGGGVDVTLFLEARGWGRYDLDDPLLGAYQATVDAATYSAGLTPGEVPGHPGNPGTLPGYNLVPVGYPDHPSYGAFQALKVCLEFPYNIPEDALLLTDCGVPDCGVGQLCVSRPDFIFYYRYAECTVAAATIDYSWSCTSPYCAEDPGDGTWFYGGTLILDVPAGATGTYNVGFVDQLDHTFMTTCADSEISDRQLTDGQITILGGRCCSNIGVGTTVCEDDVFGPECGERPGLTLFAAFESCSGPDVTDCNDNGIPDECDILAADCNANGIPDDCDILVADCNANGIPDDCDILAVDCNANGIPDDCDPDNDGDGVTNECDGCPDDPDKIEPGICGCAVDDDADSDGDTVPDCIDQCPGVDDDLFAPSCADAIPTVSAWGLTLLTLLLLVAGKVYFARRHDRAP